MKTVTNYELDLDAPEIWDHADIEPGVLYLDEDNHVVVFNSMHDGQQIVMAHDWPEAVPFAFDIQFEFPLRKLKRGATVTYIQE